MDRLSLDEFDVGAPVDYDPFATEPAAPTPPPARDQIEYVPGPASDKFFAGEPAPVTPPAPAPATAGPAIPEGYELGEPVDYDPFDASDRPGAVKRGVVSGLVGTIENASEAAGVLNRKFGGDKDSLLGQAGEMLAEGVKGGAGRYARQEPSISGVGSIGEGWEYIKESFFQGLTSTFPSLVAGAGGAALGAAGGAWTASAIPSMIDGVGGAAADLQNDPGVQAALKAGQVTQDQLDNYALAVGGMIGSLDALGAGKIISLTGLGKEAVRTATRGSLLAALKKGIKEGTVAESGTEAAQQILTEGMQAFLGGDINLGTRIVSVIDAMIQGGLTGGPTGGAGAVYDEMGKPLPPTPPATPPGGTGANPPPPANIPPTSP